MPEDSETGRGANLGQPEKPTEPEKIPESAHNEATANIHASGKSPIENQSDSLNSGVANAEKDNQNGSTAGPNAVPGNAGKPEQRLDTAEAGAGANTRTGGECPVGNKPDLPVSGAANAEGDGQDENTANTPINTEAGGAESEDDSEEDDLFVRQPGEVRVKNGCIDLSNETEAESAARAARVGACVIDLTVDIDIKVKVEDEKKDVALIPDKDTIPESEVPDDLEDVEDNLEMLRLEQRKLQRHQGQNKLKSGGLERLEALNREISQLEEKAQELTATRDAARLQGERTINDEPPVQSERPDDSTKSATTPSGAPSAAAERKRKTPSEPSGGAARKRPRRAVTSAAGRKSQKAGQESTILTLEMLHSHNTIEAGQEMAELPVLDGFNATTVKAQKEHFRGLSSKDPDADKKQIRGDALMVDRARGFFGRRYKVSGEKYLVRNMKTPLFAYQFAAAGWMIRREKSAEEPQGGILADSMGLGKTLETLACVAGNPPSEEDLESGLRTTLVIVPANAVGQWIEEVWKHCDGMPVSHYKRSDVINQAARDHSPIW